MSPSTTPPAAPAVAPAKPTPVVSPTATGQPLPIRHRWQLRAPAWLQVLLTLLLLASSVYAYLDDHILLCTLMAISGLAWGASILLTRMVGDQYGRA